MREGLPWGGGREGVETGQYLAPCVASPKRRKTALWLKSSRHINQMDRAAHYGSRYVGRIICVDARKPPAGDSRVGAQ